jgi:PAS domain S-box-containing protein
VSSVDLPDLEAPGLVEAVRDVPVAVSIIDPSGQIVYANRWARTLVEQQLGESMPDDIADGWEIFHLDGRPYSRDEWPVVRSITSGEHVIEEEYFHRLASGERLVIRCSSSAVRDAGGTIVAGLVVMVDVTADRRTAQRLSYFDRVLENIDDAIVGTDAEFRINTWNAAAERLYGYPPEEALGRPAREIASYQGDESRQELEATLLDSERTRSELTAYRRDGTRIEIEIVAVAVRNDRDDVIGYLGVHRDVSERKQAEAELHQVREAERRRLARELHDEALQELTGAIILAGERAAPGTGDELVAALMRVARQLRSAIYDLRLGSDEARPFSERLRAMVAARDEATAGAAIDLDIAGSAPALAGERATSTLRIVGEALTNARRHADASSISIRVGGADRRMTIRVADDGRGFTAEQARPTRPWGGLKSIRERADLLGAELEITTEAGSGTVVRLELDTDEGETEETRWRREPAAPSGEET